MCILCEHDALELLTAPLDSLEPGRLAEAVRAARDAAGAGILDHAEDVLRGEAPPDVDADLYAEVVVARASEAGVLDEAAAYRWEAHLATAAGALDPRVQAFVSSSIEIIDDYRVVLGERSQVIARFVEAHGESVPFAWLGDDGELWFEYRGETYAALTQAEAMEIVERALGDTLHTLPPEELLRYTDLPDSALEVLAGIQGRPPETANGILAGMIDLPALADDRVRSVGYSPYLRPAGEEAPDAVPFGDWVILRGATAP